MKIEIHSIRSLKRLAHKPFMPDTALISIGDFGTEFPPLEHQPAHILRLEFDDITLSDIDYESSGRYAFRLFSKEQANQIAEFVYRHWEDCGTLICQCHYGQSRSAAVAAAILEHFYHSGIDIFADEQERYCPNVYVFRKTLRALRNREGTYHSVKCENEG